MNKIIIVVIALFVGLTQAEYSAKIFIDGVKFNNEVTPPPSTGPDLGDIEFTSNYTSGDTLYASSSGNNFSNIGNPISTYSYTSQVIGSINHNYKNNGSSDVNLWISIEDGNASASPYEFDSSIYSNSKLMTYLMDYINAGMPTNETTIRSLNPISLASGETISLPLLVRSNYNGLSSRNASFTVKGLTSDKSYSSIHNLDLKTNYISGISSGDVCQKNTTAAPTYCIYDVSSSIKSFTVTLNNPTGNVINITNSSFIDPATLNPPSCGSIIAPANIPANGSSSLVIDLTDCPDPWSNFANYVDVGLSLSNGSGMAVRLRGY